MFLKDLFILLEKQGGKRKLPGAGFPLRCHPGGPPGEVGDPLEPSPPPLSLLTLLMGIFLALYEQEESGANQARAAKAPLG